MISSGIKRGLAASAISAMAIAGLPALASPASADSINDQQLAATNAVQLYNASGAPVSVKNDGTDATVRLEAGASPDITSITFQYSLGGATFQTIATVARNDDGAFSTEWDAAQFIGGSIVIRAVKTGDITIGDSANATIQGTAGNAPSVNLTAGTAKGVFQQPYGLNGAAQTVIVSGTSSKITGTVAVSRKLGDGSSVDTETLPVTAPVGATTGTFKGVLDITGYVYGATNELLLGASDTTEDFESYTLYNQTINAVTAVPKSTTVPTNDSTDVTVTVTDQTAAAAPIAGAEVHGSVDGFIGYTDANGQVLTSQTAITQYYYANATSDPAYVAAQGDKRSADVTVTSFEPAAKSIVATSRDGAAFDMAEYDGNDDITVQVKNQNGGDFTPTAAQTVQYYWTITPFDGTPVVRVPAATATPNSTTAVDGVADGNYKIVLPTGQREGTYQLFAGLSDDLTTPANESIASSSVLTVKAGQSAITYDEASESAPAGTSEVVDGQLALVDGTGLPGRSVRFDYTPGTGGGSNAGIVPATGTTLVNTRDFITGADGSFSLTIKDPAVVAPATQAAEINGDLDGYTIPGTVDSDDPGVGANQQVDFTLATPPNGSVVTIDPITGTDRPGEIVTGSLTVDSDPVTAGVQPVPGQLVTLAIDKGFFTDGNFATTPVVGAAANDYQTLGQTITVSTDRFGKAYFETVIGRDTGFDDDGLVKATVTATAGPASDVEDIDYTSANPVNGGTVDIALSPEGEQDGMTDPAPVGGKVAYDVFVTDQYGNPVGGEPVTITENGDAASIGGTDEDPIATGFQALSDFKHEGDFTVTSSEDDEVTVTGTWSAPYTEFTNVNGGTTNGHRPLTDSETITFAAFDLGAADITVTGNPETTAPVGSAVTETVTVVDEFGNPVQGLAVDITRVGPGSANETVSRTTNANGVASYVFSSMTAGTATITAEITSGGKTESRSDTVEFTEVATPVATDFAITSSPEGDVVAGSTVVETVTVTDADGNGFAGATVRFTRSDTGDTVSRTTNSAGQATFTVSKATAGTVGITAVVDYGTGTELLNDSITFTGGTPVRTAINAKLTGSSAGNKDVLRVTAAAKAAGATVTFFKRVGNKNVRLGTRVLGARGNTTLRIADKNGNKATRYFARVTKTVDTLGDSTDTKSVR